MPKRSGPSDAQQAAAKRGREAAAEKLRLRIAVTDAAPVANPPPASFTGSSSSTVSSSAVAPADDLLPMAAPAAATQAAPDGAMETGGSHSTVRLPAPPAGKPRARAAALSLPMCAPICTARTRNLHPTALWGRLLRPLRLHRSSPPRRPRSSPPRRSGRCLPACRCTRPVACARARSTGLRPGYGCSPAMPHWLRMPAMLKALRPVRRVAAGGGG